MILLNLHILCIKDERSEEDIRLAKQLAELELPIKTGDGNKVKNEWRFGTIIFDNVDAFYPDVTGNHTLIHTKGGSIVNIRENYSQVEAQVKSKLYQVVTMPPILNSNYSYSLPINEQVIK